MSEPWLSKFLLNWLHNLGIIKAILFGKQYKTQFVLNKVCLPNKFTLVIHQEWLSCSDPPGRKPPERFPAVHPGDFFMAECFISCLRWFNQLELHNHFIFLSQLKMSSAKLLGAPWIHWISRHCCALKSNKAAESTGWNVGSRPTDTFTSAHVMDYIACQHFFSTCRITFIFHFMTRWRGWCGWSQWPLFTTVFPVKRRIFLTTSRDICSCVGGYQNRDFKQKHYIFLTMTKCETQIHVRSVSDPPEQRCVCTRLQPRQSGPFHRRYSM